jgi:hypothetical protein
LRDSLLRSAVLFAAVAALLTEILSAFHLLRRGPLAIAWVAILACALVRWRPKLRRPAFQPIETAVGIAILAIAVAVAMAAWLSPPNSADTMAYHMPRVIYWAQNASVAFFPTPYFNQVMLAPLAEYLMLHTYLLSGGDHWINLLTFGAWIFSVIGVSSLAGALGLGSRGQAFAALFAATLPNGILQASGAKNDWLVALWLVLMTYFAARRNAAFTGLSFGLAILTKATAYLFAPPLLLATALPVRRQMALWLAGGALLLNTPQYVRNLKLSGSPLGCDSAFCDGSFRWRNERFGWKTSISNLVRNTSEQLGGRSQRRNLAIYEAALSIHRALGIDPHAPATTWPWARFEPPSNANHEANANNRWHLVFLAAAVVAAAVRRRRTWLVYLGALLAGFLLFCTYLKWQPYMARLELPLFVLGAPLAGFLLEGLRPAALAIVPCLFLFSVARLPALQNWTRPLTGSASLFRTDRRQNYFNDMAQWGNGASYVEAVERVAAAGCDSVTIDIRLNQLEYPFQALLRERRPNARFQHSGPACAILCLDCAGNEKMIAEYARSGPRIEIGRFWLFLDQLRK